LAVRTTLNTNATSFSFPELGLVFELQKLNVATAGTPRP
jgi:hypothetical protein